MKEAGIVFRWVLIEGLIRISEEHMSLLERKIERYVVNNIKRSELTPEYIQVSGGLFMDMTIHDFDMARYHWQEVIQVYATTILVDKSIAV